MRHMGSLLAAILLTAGPLVAQDSIPPQSQSREVVRFGTNYTLEAGESVRELVIIGGSATIRGEVQRDAVIIGGSAELAGTGRVDGDFIVLGGGAVIASGSAVDGDLVVVGGGLESPPGFAPGGELVVAETVFDGEMAELFQNLGAWVEGLTPLITRGLLLGRVIVPDLLWVWVVVGVLLAVFLGLNVVFDAPVRACAQVLAHKPLTTFLIGLLVLALAGPVSLMLAVSVVGLTIVPFVWGALVAAGLIGGVAVSRWFGDTILGSAPADNRARAALSLLVGFALICLALMVPVLGAVSAATLGVLALGAAAVAVANGLRRENPVPAPDSAPVRATPPPEVTTEELPPGDLASLPRATFLARTGAFLLDLLLVALISGLLGLGASRWFLALLIAYNIALWTWRGATVGGIIAQMRVVRTDGLPLTLTDALVRGLSSIFSVAVLGLGFFWILKDPERESWHDKIAGTCVVAVPNGWTRA